MPQTPALDAEPVAPRWKIVGAVALLLGMLFLFNEHNFPLLTGQLELSPEEYRDAQYMGSADDTKELVETGSVFRRISYPLLGLCGAALLLLGKRPHTVNGMLLTLACMLYLWCLLSVAWSDVPALTVKRLLLLSCCFAGILGISRALTLTELTTVALVVACGFVLFSLAIEVSLGVFEPWQSDYRFAGIVHPNTQGGYCGTMLISALALSVKRERFSSLLVAAMGLAFVLMVLTKSRSTMVGVVMASAAAWTLYAPAHKRVAAFTIAPLVLIAALAAMTLQGLAEQRNLEAAANLGREEGKLQSLNGRIPLWGYLLEPIGNSPVLGYGYDSFWTPHQIVMASNRLEWTIPNSHNALLEVQLNLGIVGSLLFAALGISSIALTLRRLSLTREPILIFPAALGMFALVNSLFEASYSQPTGFDTFIAYCALSMAAMLPSRAAVADRIRTPQQGWGRPGRSRPLAETGPA